MNRLRRWTYELLEPSISNSAAARAVEFVLIMLVFFNIIIILESVKSIHEVYHPYFYAIESFSVLIFSIEYVLRLWTSVENPKYQRNRWAYFFSGMALIDLLSIIPFLVDILLGFMSIDLLFLRIVRLFRLFRLLKIARYLKALNLMLSVLRERKEQILVSIMLILFLLVIVSTVMYHVEHAAQPEAFSSIPAAMWWGIATLTTVGYGDIVPVTIAGKVFGGMITILGIGLFALPAGIFCSGLTDYLHQNDRNRKVKRCPHCGGEFHG